MLLVVSHQGNQLVACACERAEAAGVRAGMTIAHARSLLTNTPSQVRPFTPEQDVQALERLGGWALRFSPVVAVDPPDGLLLDIAGCEHLHGGEENIAERVASSIEQFGFSIRVAVASNFGCARAVARYAENRITIVPFGDERASLSPLPVRALRIATSALEALSEVGIERIGQLLDLPRDELPARFGDAVLHGLDQALGMEPEIIEPIRPRPPLQLSREFDGPVTNLEAIELTTKELLAELGTKLQKEEGGVCQLILELRRMDLTPACLSISLTHPSRDRDHLWSLMRPRLEQVSLGYGVEEITLRAVRTQRVSHQQMELWSDGLFSAQAFDAAALGRLLDQLIDRLGKTAVTRIKPVEAYVPEQAFVATPISPCMTPKGVGFNSRGWAEGPTPGYGIAPKTIDPERVGSGRAKGTLSGSIHAPDSTGGRAALDPRLLKRTPAGSQGRQRIRKSSAEPTNIYSAKRPSRLFSNPEPARVMALVPDGPPAWLEWKSSASTILIAYGPERIAPPWWTGEIATGTRDYFEVQDEHGRWLWLFREIETGRWFVHGEWA